MLKYVKIKKRHINNRHSLVKLVHKEHYEGQSDRPADAGPKWNEKPALNYWI